MPGQTQVAGSILDGTENHNSAIVSRVSPPRDGADYVTNDFNITTESLQNISQERTKKMQISDTSARSRQRVHSHTRRGIVRVAMGTEWQRHIILVTKQAYFNTLQLKLHAL
jgi:hypothetical protein